MSERILHDLMAGPAGTLIEAHLPTTDVVGNGWVVYAGAAAEVQLDGAGNVHNTAAGAHNLRSLLFADVTSADQSVTVIGKTVGSGAGDRFVAVVRALDDPFYQYWYAQIRGDGYVQLFEQNNYVASWNRGSSILAGFNPATEYKLTLSAVGNLITVSVDDVIIHSYLAEAAITNITQSNPCQVTIPSHGLTAGAIHPMTLTGIGGMVELEGWTGLVTYVNANAVTLNGVNSFGYTPYTSGGIAAHPGDAGRPEVWLKDTNALISEVSFYNITPPNFDIATTDVETQELTIAQTSFLYLNQGDTEAQSFSVRVLDPLDVDINTIDVEVQTASVIIPTVFTSFAWYSPLAADANKADVYFEIIEVSTGYIVDLADGVAKAAGHGEASRLATPVLPEGTYTVTVDTTVFSGKYRWRMVSPSTSYQPGMGEEDFVAGEARKAGLSVAEANILQGLNLDLYALDSAVAANGLDLYALLHIAKSDSSLDKTTGIETITIPGNPDIRIQHYNTDDMTGTFDSSRPSFSRKLLT